MSQFFGVQMAANALRSFQFALMTTSHNIANVNTPGYSRQTISLGEQPHSAAYGARGLFYVGNGVDTVGISRVRDMFLQQRYLQVGTDEGRYGTLADNLRLTQASFGELSGSSGISTQLDNFFNAFQSLSANPTDLGVRSSVRQAADALTHKFRSLNSDLVTQQTNIGKEIQGRITELNDLGGKLTDLNHQVVAAQAAGASPNDLMDQREQIVSQMSALADVRTSVQPNGTMDVFLEQHTLVDQQGLNALSTTIDTVNGTITAGSIAIKVTGGTIGGDFESLAKVSGYKTQLDTLAAQIVTQVNALHRTGYALDGSTGHDLFTGTNASNFDLSADVKSSANNIVAAAVNLPGDGSLALAIANLRTAPVGSIGGVTMSQYYISMVSTLGTDLKSAEMALAAQTSIRKQVEEQIQANSGVNLDEEMSNMLQYQRSYQAAAKLLTIMDSVVEETIQAFGR